MEIAALKRRRHYLDWRYSGQLAGELQDILEQIEWAAPCPQDGVRLAAAFLKTDRAVLESGDDSSGYVGDVYRDAACALFARFAIECADKGWLAKVVLGLLRDDEYSVRLGILDHADRYFTVDDLRRLADQLLGIARGTLPASESGGTDGRGSADSRNSTAYASFAVESLARSLKDPGLLESVFRTRTGELQDYQRLELASLCLQAGMPTEALAWLMNDGPPSEFIAEEHDTVLLQVHVALGQTGEAEQLAWRLFRARRSQSRLDQLLAVIGAERCDEVLLLEAAVIASQAAYCQVDLMFMVETDLLRPAEQYVVSHHGALDGGRYEELLHAAHRFATSRCPLAASLCYRALVNSILDRRLSASYHHAARYIAELRRLTNEVRDWRGMAPHESYMESLQTLHWRKHAFWRALGEKARP